MRAAGDEARGAGGAGGVSWVGAGGRGASLGGAVALGLVAYAALAWSMPGDGVRVEWLLGAQAAGWAALWWAWRALGSEGVGAGAKVWIVVGLVGYRLCGLWTTPAWEDDYFRYLWDGWMTWHRGSPYGTPPLDWFASAAVPEAMQAVLDGVNNPERPTIYGPVAQAWFAAAAALGAGKLWVLKAGLLVAEGAGLWALTRWAGWRALLIAGWCPLAVTEIAFAGHADALCVAAVAGALLAQARGRGGWAAVLLAAGCATKAYAMLLAPFFLWRGSWRESVRAGAVWLAAMVLLYAPWIWMTHAADERSGAVAAVLGLDSAGAMAGGFEFNSTGFALLAWWLGDEAGRLAAAAALAGCAGVVVVKWIRNEAERGGEETSGAEGRWGVTVAAPLVVAAWAWWSPVFHPWYALLALPFWARRPTEWGMALLAALPLSYLHGLTLAAGASGAGDFRHPAWVRPLEAGVVVVVAGWAWWRARRGGMACK
jgi:hypothetical protein